MWNVASVTVNELSVVTPEGALIVARMLFSIGIVPWLYQVVLKFGAPEPAPAVRLTTGGMSIVTSARLLLSVPSLATKLTVSESTPGPVPVLL